MNTHYWLMKSEPDVFGIHDLAAAGCAPWDGVRNYQVRNMLRDELQVGDQAFFYHSSCAEPAIVGVMRIIRGGYPDYTALEPTHRYFDPKSTPDKLPWYCVDVEFVRQFSQPLTLKTLREQSENLHDLTLLKRGNRLSIMPISTQQWHFIHQLAGIHSLITA